MPTNCAIKPKHSSYLRSLDSVLLRHPSLYVMVSHGKASVGACDSRDGCCITRPRPDDARTRAAIAQRFDNRQQSRIAARQEDGAVAASSGLARSHQGRTTL